MNAVEFTTELNGARAITLPPEIAAELPASGSARVIVLTEENAGDARWEELLQKPGVGARVAEYFEEAAREGKPAVLDRDRL